MSSACFVCGFRIQFGNTVSNSNQKTRRRFQANVFDKNMYSDLLKQNFNISLSARGLRTIYKHGSFDQYLLTTRPSSLTPEAYKIQKLLRKLNKQNESKTAS